MKSHYDCVVVGGGPAGCSTAALVAEAGFSTLLLEREKVPRFHVGESLMPEVYWPLERLGVLDQMKNSEFVKKYSVQFVSHTGKESQPFFFKNHDPRECSQTWQVERSKFDQMLFDNAASKGADCADETRVLGPLLEGQKATGVKIQTADGQPREISARVVVDATGQQAMLARRMGIYEENPEMKKAAIWTYYRGAKRDEGENGGATIILHTEGKKCWYWFIPLSNGVTSIGLVGDHEHLLKRETKPEDFFHEEMQRCPALLERLQDAEQIEDVRIAKEFSYTTQQQAGDGWVLVGDAFGFIDPLYSSGVYFALKSGEMAADAIADALRKDDVSATQLSSWTGEFLDGAQWIRKLVRAFYTEEFSFGRFMHDHPQYKGNLTDLLIGRIFHDGAGDIFQDLEPAVERAKGRFA